MGWEQGGRYYTRSIRVNGKVQREYVGCGETAHLCARLDAFQHEKRQREQEHQRTEAAEMKATCRFALWYFAAVEQIVRDALTAAGLHQHKRGEWRRWRKDHLDMSKKPLFDYQQLAQEEQIRRQAPGKALLQACERDLATKAVTVPETPEERRVIVLAAMNGDESRKAQALACVRQYPLETVIGWGNPKGGCMDLVCPSAESSAGHVVRQAVQQEYDFYRKKIEGENPTPLEKLLAERITVLHFQISYFERLYGSKLSQGLSLEHSEHHVDRLERLNKQLLRAVESLAKVRRLQRPAVMVGQLNVAGQQVNYSPIENAEVRAKKGDT